MSRSCDLARALVEEFDLVGVNGIDFVARDGLPYAIEVNPRWCASMELVERAHEIFGVRHARRKRVPLARFPNSTSRDRSVHLVRLARRWSLRRETSWSGTDALVARRMPPFKTCRRPAGERSVSASRSVRQSLPTVVTRKRVAWRSCNARKTCITTTASSSGKQSSCQAGY